MIRHVKSFARHGNAEDLHGIRVRLKKLRSLANLSKKCSDTSFKKQLEPVRKIFSVAGKVRSSQLTMRFMDKYKVRATDFRLLQKHFIENAAKKLRFDTAGNVSKIKKMRRILRRHVHVIPEVCVRQFYQDRLKQAEALLYGPVETDLIHSCRKKIKDILYLHRSLAASVKLPLLDTGYLDRLQDAIGKWHDILSAANFLGAKAAVDERELSVFKREAAKIWENIYATSRNFSKKVAGSGTPASSL